MRSHTLCHLAALALAVATAGTNFLGSETVALAAEGGADGAAPQSGGPAPRVIVPHLAYDFGKVPSGTPVEHTFTLRNGGAAPLRVERIHAACGCTAAMIDSNVIAPGEEAKIKTTFDTTGFQGAKMKTVRVFTNDPRQSSFVLSLKGYVQSEVELQPVRLFFGDVMRGQSPSLAADIAVAAGADAKVIDVSSKSPYVDARLDDSGKPRVVATIRPNAPVGVLRERIVIRTTSPQAPVLNLPVFARIQGDLQLLPSTVSFGLVEGPLTSPLTEEVRLLNRSAQPMKVISVRSDNELVAAEAVPGRDGKGSIIRVTLRQGLFGAFRAKILITTDNPDADQRELTLPVYGIVSRKGS